MLKEAEPGDDVCHMHNIMLMGLTIFGRRRPEAGKTCNWDIGSVGIGWTGWDLGQPKCDEFFSEVENGIFLTCFGANGLNQMGKFKIGKFFYNFNFFDILRHT